MSQLVVRELSRSLLRASGKAVCKSQCHPAVRRAELKMLIRKYVTETEPAKMPFGLLKVSIVTAVTLYLGGLAAKGGAAFLEENEIFVPSDGDDDFQ